MKTNFKFFFSGLTAFLLLSTVSCKKNETAESKSESKKTVEVKNDSPYLDESIVKYLKDKLSESEAKPEIDETKESVTVSYAGNEDEGIPSTYSDFSKRKKEAVYGDLNGDGKDEVVVTVHTDGGTAHLQWMSIYIFTQRDNTWVLLNSADSELFFSTEFVEDGTMCGQLTPNEIKDGWLKTSMDCFFADGNNYDVTLKLENNRLVFVKKELKKPE